MVVKNRISTKVCSRCGLDKPVSEFYWKDKEKGRLQSRCKQCISEVSNQRYKDDPEYVHASNRRRYRENREWFQMRDLRRAAVEYGLDPDLVVKYYEDHDGLCDICRQPAADRDWKRRGESRLCIDHDHETGEFRGLLCRKCNLAIAFMNDNPKWLITAADYLEAAGRSDMPDMRIAPQQALFAKPGPNRRGRPPKVVQGGAIRPDVPAERVTGAAHGSAKLADEAVVMIREARGQGVPVATLAAKYGVSKTTVISAAKGRSYPGGAPIPIAVCKFPDCARPAFRRPSGTGDQPSFCDDPDHNAWSAKRERARIARLECAVTIKCRYPGCEKSPAWRGSGRGRQTIFCSDPDHNKVSAKRERARLARPNTQAPDASREGAQGVLKSATLSSGSRSTEVTHGRRSLASASADRGRIWMTRSGCVAESPWQEEMVSMPFSQRSSMSATSISSTHATWPAALARASLW